MIQFLIYEENKELEEICVTLIEKTIINYDFEYNIAKINLESAKKYEYPTAFKIYILSLNNKIGLNLAKEIREQRNDWQSMIIFTSNCQKEVTSSRLFIVDCIETKGNYKQRLQEALKISLANFDSRPNTLKYTYRNTVYNIDFYKIIYIEKELDNKRCLIKTLDKSFYIPGNLTQVEKLLDKRFIKCSKSYLINIEQVEQYNTKDNLITFKNGITLDAVSRSKKTIMIDYLRGLKNN